MTLTKVGGILTTSDSDVPGCSNVGIDQRREMITLPQIEIKKDESFEAAMRRFKRQVEQEGILREVRNRKHYEKPSERKRRKAKGKR